MWMLAGVVTLIGMSIFLYRRRLEDRWRPVPLHVPRADRHAEHSRRYQPIEGALYSSVNRGRVHAPLQRIGYDQAPAVELRAKTQRWWDHLFTALGISVSCRTGNRDFDRAFYLVLDQAPVCRALTACPRTQAKMLEIRRLAEEHGVRFRQLRVRRGRVWVEVAARKRKDKPAATLLARAFVPALRELSVAMDDEIPMTARGGKDRFAWKAALIAAISSALLVTGILSILPLHFFPLPAPLASAGLVTLSLLLAAAVVALLVALTFVWLGRTSRTHLVLLELLLTGFLGATLTSYGLLRDANMTLDGSAAERHVVTVHEKTVSRSRRSTRYYLYLSDWHGQGGTRKIRVGHSLYQSVPTGRPVDIVERDGRLGIPWIRIDPGRP